MCFSRTIRIKDQNGEETMFKIKRTTKMKKVFVTYASRKGVEASTSESCRHSLDIFQWTFDCIWYFVST